MSSFWFSGTWGTAGPGFRGLCGLVRRGRGMDSLFACVRACAAQASACVTVGFRAGPVGLTVGVGLSDSG